MFYAFVVVVCGLTVFDWWLLRCAFLGKHQIWAAVLLVFMLGLLLLPVWARHILGHYTVGRYLEQASWIWLAWSMWLGFGFAALYAGSYAVSLLMRYCGHPVSHLSLTHSVYGALAMVLLATLWGTIEVNCIRLKTVDISSPAVPKADDGYKIALISDVHLGNAATEWRVARTVELVNDAHPNLILSAGDLIDGRGERVEQLAALLNGMHGVEGCRKIGVFGNHDVYSTLGNSRRLHGVAGFELLANSAADINDWLWLYGEDDPASGWHPGHESMPLRDANGQETYPQLNSPRHFCLLLKHRPDGCSSVFGEKAGFALELSGHSHGGQIFPFNLLVRLQHRYTESELHTLPDGMKLYVSPGTGVWGMPFRVLARPEVTLFVLHHANQ